jgi:hypothetical protein
MVSGLRTGSRSTENKVAHSGPRALWICPRSRHDTLSSGIHCADDASQGRSRFDRHGNQVNEAVDVQAVWFDAGRFKGGDTTPLGTEFGGTFKLSGFGLTGGYRWEFATPWSLAGRVGLAAMRTRFDYANTIWGSASKTTVQPLLGIGLAYAITPTVRLSLDYDLTRFKVHTTRGPLQMLGLAVQYSF